MHFKILLICAIFAAVKAGYLSPALRYAAPAPAIAYAATPAVGYAAPAIARVEHLAPAVASFHKSEVYSAPLIRSAHIAPTAHVVAPSPLIAASAAYSTPLLRGYGFGHSFGYAAAAPLGFARHSAIW